MLLALTRDRSGRAWRLADTCAACAAATSHTAVVPDTLLSSPRPQPAAHPRPAAHTGPRTEFDERVRVREMLTYLGAALPRFTSPAARLLALQCALRADTRAHVRLPAGLLRGMRLRQNREVWLELAHAGWLELPDVRAMPWQVRLLDATVLDQAPGRRTRCRAADWALRPVPLVLPATTPALRLTALVLAAHTGARPEHSTDMDILTRLCGHSAQQAGELLDRLVTTRTLRAWHHNRETDEVFWQLPHGGTTGAVCPYHLYAKASCGTCGAPAGRQHPTREGGLTSSGAAPQHAGSPTKGQHPCPRQPLPPLN
ncbi:hypothetical protein [Streptomyces sp. 4F14]|uniref:hypothetical protein n=1 Tax=Streptomyces sp. 4F14 TaxID=3394380 RepID=UPI003A892928